MLEMREGVTTFDGLDHPTWPGPARKLRTFDVEAVAPYDHKGLVAFLRADKLQNLNSAQIRIFLLLRDTVAPEGLRTAYISEHLEMSRRSVSSCLSVLKRLGYARHSSAEGHDGRTRIVVGWVYDPSHWFSDEEFLFWEFGEL